MYTIGKEKKKKSMDQKDQRTIYLFLKNFYPRNYWTCTQGKKMDNFLSLKRQFVELRSTFG